MANNYIDLPEEGGTGVASINGLTGALTLVAGSGITITPSGSNITIASTGGGGSVTSVSVVSANGLAGTVANATTTPAITLSTSVTGILIGNGTAINAATPGTDYVIPSGSITGTASNITASSNSTLTTLSALSLPYSQLTGAPAALTFTSPLSLSGSTVSIPVATTSANGYLSSTDWTTFNGKQAAGSYITALTGDATAAGPGSSALTLATVNTNTGSFGSSTSIPSFTVNGKGLITAASGNAVVAPAGTLSGTTLNSSVVTSSLTTVGTIGTGVWQGTAVGIGYGGTGASSTSQNFAFIGPTSGSGAPLFRALVAGDIPSLSSTYLPLTGGTLTGNLSWSSATAGQILVASPSTAGATGLNMSLSAANGNGSGLGGNLTLSAGNSGTGSTATTAAGGTVNINGGAGGRVLPTLGGPGGAISIAAGAGNGGTTGSGNGGAITIAAGAAGGGSASDPSGNGGAVTISGGSANPTNNGAAANGGAITIYGGAAVNSGTIGNVLLAYNGSSAIGSVGIGTGSPSYTLDVAGNTGTKHLVGRSSAPTIAAGAGAGSSPTVSIAGTDLAGQVTVTTGTLPSGSNAVVATITFNGAYSSAPYCIFSPANTNAAILSGVTMIYTTSTTTTFVINSGTSALTASTTYVWNYLCSQ